MLVWVADILVFSFDTKIPSPFLWGLRCNPLPMQRASIFSLCLFDLANSVLAILNSFMVLAIPAAPPAIAPAADNPAKIGIRGNTPPLFGIGITRGSLMDKLEGIRFE